MTTPNPYAPPAADVEDIFDPSAPQELADRLTRLGAALLDGLIAFGLIGIPALVGLIAGGASTGFDDESAAPAMAIGVVLGCAGFVVWCWLTVRYVAANGQSIAKKLLNIKVVRSDGSRASLGRIFWLRNVVNTLLTMIPVYELIDVLFIFGETRQCLHDKLADTIVVKA